MRISDWSSDVCSSDLVAREAAKIRDPVALGRLTDSLTRQRRAARAKDVQGFFSLDEEFHQSLAEAAGRPAAWRAVEDAKPQMERVRYHSMEDATTLAILVRQLGSAHVGTPVTNT